MQIKRFEAADMTEALRMVKRELGDNAVILSAKEVRPGGFFRSLRKKSVEIAAANDCPVGDAHQSNDFSGLLSEHLCSQVETDRVSLSSLTQPPNIPPASKFRPLSHQSPAPETPHSPLGSRVPTPQPGLIPDELQPGMGDKHGGGIGEGLIAEEIESVNSSPLIAKPFYRDTAAKQIVALVGPCGVGKSTSVAKLAWHCHVAEKKRVGLISLDRFRIGANGMLRRVSRIMGLPLKIVRDDDQLQLALNDLIDVDLVLIDTPGISGKESSMMADVCELLRSAKPHETHLVANATLREDVFEAFVSSFSPLGVNRLLITHMDEDVSRASGLKLLKISGLPSSFYSDGVELSDGLKESTAKALSGIVPRREPVVGQVEIFSNKRNQIKSGSASGDLDTSSDHFVANRNSELFHHSTCKSVKRINAKNLAAFNGIQQAMDEGFKPCRACCDIGMIRRSITEGAAFPRARAI
jgi:flagellar biosynthesis protein FlhF